MSLRVAHREGFVEQRVVELVRVRVGAGVRGRVGGQG